ncbi:FAD binding domain-containing protein [Foetidibacter luteolus]|uniref:FAD binding domain-containing protein n=1 Tax=Foetidibacter luteolus TaxID=2608880 RepID=UPI001A97F6CB|nr:xanthine dehydrogenase family protein subunit M [Foetidibacter luteolus]
MTKFSFTKATDANDAVLKASSLTNAAFIAGGTNLVDLMKENVARPGALVDINQLPLHTITETEEGGLMIGALVTNAATAYNPLVEKHYPLLSKAILAGASPQLRNMATAGGNLLQRTRCYYFYDTATACNKRNPGSGCPAINGFNRMHAILGASEACIAVHPSDMCIALAALNARIHVLGTGGTRTIGFNGFHRLPAETPEAENNLQPGELITAIELPAEDFSSHYQYIKVRDRSSYAFALVSVAVALQMDGNIIKEARLALGGVAHKPWRNPVVEEHLRNQQISAPLLQDAAEMMLAGARGYGHNNFKIELAKRVIIRAINEAAGIL